MPNAEILTSTLSFEWVQLRSSNCHWRALTLSSFWRTLKMQTIQTIIIYCNLMILLHNFLVAKRTTAQLANKFNFIIIVSYTQNDWDKFHQWIGFIFWDWREVKGNRDFFPPEVILTFFFDCLKFAIFLFKFLLLQRKEKENTTHAFFLSQS